MTSHEVFSKRLKQLRGETSIKELAQKSGLSQTALYKAESGEESVSWKTIETAYGDLCGGEDLYAELLTLWAMTQSLRIISLYRMREALDTAIRDEAMATSREILAAAGEMEMMTVPQQRDFVKFSILFRKSEMTRRMASLWMESEEQWNAMLRNQKAGN